MEGKGALRALALLALLVLAVLSTVAGQECLYTGGDIEFSGVSCGALTCVREYDDSELSGYNENTVVSVGDSYSVCGTCLEDCSYSSCQADDVDDCLACGMNDVATSALRDQQFIFTMDVCSPTEGASCRCGPSQDFGDGAGCTSGWCAEKCVMQDYTFQFSCRGEGEYCSNIDPTNYGNDIANDIRDVLSINDFAVFLIQQNNLATWAVDPDADGVAGITTEFRCYTRGIPTAVAGSPQTRTKPSAGDCANAGNWNPLCGKFADTNGNRFIAPYLYADMTQRTNPTCDCCGNGICEVAFGENCTSCPYDCLSFVESDADGENVRCCGAGEGCYGTSCNLELDLNGNTAPFLTCDAQSTVDDCSNRYCPTASCADRRYAVTVDLSDLGPTCSLMPLAIPSCAVETIFTCDECLPGCDTDFYECDTERCACVLLPECEECFTVVNPLCDRDGFQNCVDDPDNVLCDTRQVRCADREENLCCVPCDPFYVSVLADDGTCGADSLVSDVHTYACCPENQRPDSTKCGCDNCPTDHYTSTSVGPCSCGRPQSFLNTIPGQENYNLWLTPTECVTAEETYTFPAVLVEDTNNDLIGTFGQLYDLTLYRYNPFSCKCEECPIPQSCPTGQIVFPPPSFYSSLNLMTLDVVLQWVSTVGQDTTTCPTCRDCSELAALGALIPLEMGQLCVNPETGDTERVCECSDCPDPSVYGCEFDWGFVPAQSHPEIDDYIRCIENDPVCDVALEQIRDPDSTDCGCLDCECPAGREPIDENANKCYDTQCVDCYDPGQGRQPCNECDEGSQYCVIYDLPFDDPAFDFLDYEDCTDPCTCQCVDCALFNDRSVRPQRDNCKYNTQYDWGIFSDCDPNNCQRCQEINNCTALGMAYNVSDDWNCSCIPCTEETFELFLPEANLKCEKLGQWLVTGPDYCRCESCPIVDDCDRCTEQVELPHRCACEACDLEPSQEPFRHLLCNWNLLEAEDCDSPPYGEYWFFDDTTNTVNCSQCHPCEADCIWSPNDDNGYCSWQQRNPDCKTFSDASCTGDFRIADINSDGVLDSDDVDDLRCPVCMSKEDGCPIEQCPFGNVSITDPTNIDIAPEDDVFVMDESCSECSPFECEAFKPNFYLTRKEVPWGCADSANATCHYEECEECQFCDVEGVYTPGLGCGPDYEPVPGDTCNCQTCTQEVCDGFNEAVNASDACDCRDCTCEGDCRQRLIDAGYCDLTPSGYFCHGCIDNDQDGRCESSVYCDGGSPSFDFCRDGFLVNNFIDIANAEASSHPNQTVVLPRKQDFSADYFCTGVYDLVWEDCEDQITSEGDIVCDLCNEGLTDDQRIDIFTCAPCEDCPEFTCADTSSQKHEKGDDGEPCYCLPCINCTCGVDCQPETGKYCDPSALCDEPKVCTDCPPDTPLQLATRRTLEQVIELNGDPCDPDDICTCNIYDCSCGVDCFPVFLGGESRWSYCDQTLCNSDSNTPCPVCNSTAEIKRRPKTLEEILAGDQCDPVDVCECIERVCKCNDDCTPYDNFTGTNWERFYCEDEAACNDPIECPSCEDYFASLPPPLNDPENYEVFERTYNLTSQEICDLSDPCACPVEQCRCHPTDQAANCNPSFDSNFNLWYTCNSSALCDSPTLCPDCTEYENAPVYDPRFEILVPKLEVDFTDVCSEDVCRCKTEPCTCGPPGESCTPVFDYDEQNWYYCNYTDAGDVYCQAPLACPSCDEWAAANGVSFDPTQEFWLNRTDDYPGSGTNFATLCADPCTCRKEKCDPQCTTRGNVDEYSGTEPVVGDNCAPCENCTRNCPAESGNLTWPTVSFLGDSGSTDISVMCAAYWEQPAVKDLNDDERNGLRSLSDLCVPGLNPDGDLTCTCITTFCECVECSECETCDENKFGGTDAYDAIVCLLTGGVTETQLDTLDDAMYYRDTSNTCGECLQCDPCDVRGDGTTITHRRVSMCNEDGADCNFDECVNWATNCPANHDVCECSPKPCLPVFSETLLGTTRALETNKYCDGSKQQHALTSLETGSRKTVRCDNCTDCECSDAGCAPFYYADPDNWCGNTTGTTSCGVFVEVGSPCSCEGDACEVCLPCPAFRWGIWENADVSTRCPYGFTEEWNETKLVDPEVCLGDGGLDCDDPNKAELVCEECNCKNCTDGEEDYIKGLCERYPGVKPGSCLDGTAKTCNDFWKDETLFPEKLFYYDEGNCSCYECGDDDGNYTHVEPCDPYNGTQALTDDKCDCTNCTKNDDLDLPLKERLCCPDEYDPADCKPELGLKPHPTYCGCIECADECSRCENPTEICWDPSNLGLEFSIRVCEEKFCKVTEEPADANCSLPENYDVPCCMTLAEDEVLRERAGNTCRSRCFGCQNCTGIDCTTNQWGEPVYGQKPDPDDLCNCLDCLDYWVPANTTSVLLTSVELPAGLPAADANEFLLLASPDWDLERYWDYRCNETELVCGELLCNEIGVLLGEDLTADADNPCKCVACPYNNTCPVCPYCDSIVDPDCNCFKVTEPGTTGFRVVCGVPDECNGELDCDLSPRAGVPFNSSYCYWELDTLPFRPDASPSDDCLCSYKHRTEDCTEPLDNDECVYPEICNPNKRCKCDCEDYCSWQGVEACPARTCQADRCDFFRYPGEPEPPGCSPCPNMTECILSGGWIVPILGDNITCDSDRCACERCEKTCDPPQVLDKENCECVDCSVNCTAPYYYVFEEWDPENPKPWDELCYCEKCDENLYNCEADVCEECRTLEIVDNVCTCVYCNDLQGLVSGDAFYPPSSCPFDEFGVNIPRNLPGVPDCQCGPITNPTINVTTPTPPTDLCELFYGSATDGCGCCANETEVCLANNGTAEECACVTTFGCDGQCGTDIFIDDCGRVCPENDLCDVITNYNETYLDVCVLTVDACGECGGNGSTCLDCFNVSGGNAVVDECGVCGGNGECTVVVVTVASTVGAVAGGVSIALIFVATSAGIILAGAFIRRCHARDAVISEWEMLNEQEVDLIVASPLYADMGVDIFNPLSDAADGGVGLLD